MQLNQHNVETFVSFLQEEDKFQVKGKGMSAPLDGATNRALKLESKEAADIISHVADVNRSLEQQIDALRMRLDVDFKRYENDKEDIVLEKERELESRQKKIIGFEKELNIKDIEIQRLNTENVFKIKEIKSLKTVIVNLKSDIKESRINVEKLQKDIAQLQDEKDRTQRSYRDETKTDGLKADMEIIKNRFFGLEQELVKTKEIIFQQNGKNRYLENEKNIIQSKFKDDIGRVTATFRIEVDRIRDVMKKQCEETKALREQNSHMSRNITEIRDILLSNKAVENNAVINAETPETRKQRVTEKNEGYVFGPDRVTLPALDVTPRKVTNGRGRYI